MHPTLQLSGSTANDLMLNGPMLFAFRILSSFNLLPSSAFFLSVFNIVTQCRIRINLTSSSTYYFFSLPYPSHLNNIEIYATMPPKKRSRLQMSSTPTTIREDSAMDVDSPRISGTPGFLSSAFKPIIPVTPYDNLWTDDQISSLFKGVIRWKPAGSLRPPR